MKNKKRGGEGEEVEEVVVKEEWSDLFLVKNFLDHLRLEEPGKLGQEDTIPEVILKLGDRGQILLEAHLNPPKEKKEKRKEKREKRNSVKDMKCLRNPSSFHLHLHLHLYQSMSHKPFYSQKLPKSESQVHRFNI